jgi:drug/metabolite transporter (DMT)-like permease
MGANPSAKAMLASLGSAVIFGFSFLSSRIALGVATPWALLSMRFLLALALMSAVLLTGKAKVSLRGKPVGLLLLLGFFQPIMYFVCETYGILYSTATFSGVMIALIPIASLAFAAIFLRERPTVWQTLFSLLSVAGVVVLALLQTGEGAVEVRGILLLVGAIVAAVGCSIVSRKIAPSFSAFERTYVMFVTGAVFFTIAALFENGWDVPALVAPLAEPKFLLPILYLGGFSSVGAFLLMNYGLAHLPVSRSTSFANLTTVISMLAGVVFLGEPMSLLSGVASLMIVLGVWGVQKMSLRSV